MFVICSLLFFMFLSSFVSIFIPCYFYLFLLLLLLLRYCIYSVPTLFLETAALLGLCFGNNTANGLVNLTKKLISLVDVWK